MRIDELYASSDEPVFSFEFFPPKTDEGERNFWNALGELRALDPAFVSVTYGAGGSTKDKTLEIVSRVRDEFGIEAMAHFTCVGATVEQLREQLDAMREAGLENVLALRGDPPAGQEEWRMTPSGLIAELEARSDDPDAVADFGVAYATLQCADLLAAGAPGIHFYTLNRSPATRAILSALRLTRPWARTEGLLSVRG